MKPILFATGVILLATGLASATIMVFAPHLPRLAMEGYPAPRWPAAGLFAPVAGNPFAAPYAAMGKLNARLSQLIEESDGKALLAYRDDRLLLAYYAADVQPETRYNSYSLAKSLVGALLMKAVADGKIDSLDDPIGKYLPATGDRSLQQVPLRAFARMRSGLATETGAAKSLSGSHHKALEAVWVNPFDPMAKMHITGLEGIADDLTSQPERRGRFSYQNTNTALIGAVLSKAYGKPLQQLLAEKIWRPSGAAPADWRVYGNDLPVSPYCCIFATASDWLRVGAYLMHNGDEDNPFLPNDLWQEFFGVAVAPADRAAGNYGIHIYHDVLNRTGEPLQGSFSYMLGRGGQAVYMMPEQKLVVVRFGEGNQLLHSTLYAAWRGLEH